MLFGGKGAGKSTWLQHTLSRPEYRSHLVWDLMREHQTLNRYVPDNRRGDKLQKEFQVSMERLVLEADRSERPELVAVEEASRVAPNAGGVPDALAELVDLNRHYGVGLLGVARRPAQVWTDLVELADNIIIYRLTGKNDVRRLNQEMEGLGDAARELDNYEFIRVTPDRRWSIHDPVPEMDTTANL